MTPYKPSAPNARVTRAAAPRTSTVNRRRAVDARTALAIDCTSKTGSAASISWTMRWIAGASAAGSPAVRTTSAIVRAARGPAGSVYSVSGKYTTGEGTVANDESRVPATTPTTVYQRLVGST